MSYDKEIEIRLQFLDEAQEYLDTLDSAILGISSSRVDTQKINAALRAAHSIKGGAAMMGFEQLSHLAHRLEDFFKVLKSQKGVEITASVEGLLLSAIASVRTIISRHRQNQTVELDWLDVEVVPVFEQLHNQLGEPPEEDAASVLAPEEGQDILPMLFETEVEGCLQRLETVLVNPAQPCLQEELTILSQELGGLGEMLQLPAFSQLCGVIGQLAEAHPEQIEPIAHAALQAWRRSQALVMIGQLNELPTTLAGLELEAIAPPVPVTEAPAHLVDTNVMDVLPEITAEQLETISESMLWDELETDPLNLDVPTTTWEEEIAAAQWIDEQEWKSFQQEHQPSADMIELEPATSPAEAIESESPAETIASESPAETLEFEPPAQVAVPLNETPVTHFKILEAAEPRAAFVEEDETVTVRVTLRQLNALNDQFGELTIERNGLELYLKRLRGLVSNLTQRVHTLERVNAQMRTAYDRNNQHLAIASNSGYAGSSLVPSHYVPSSAFDSLEMDQYSELHHLSQQVMEMIVQIQEVAGDMDLNLDDAEQAARSLGKTARQLQTSLTKVRMRPLSDIVDRFPRALREMCLQHGKKAHLTVTGATTLIDHHILDALNDPLLHLLRNAFDHGIEAPEIRATQGKSEEGVIQIQASHRGNWTVISISDDGRGISLDKIRARAQQMGLDSTLLEVASDQELLSLIFEPGFSTSDQVTALSGRGVGMDVVRESLRQIRGEISVNTTAGEGTTFTLAVPFTLSVTNVQLVESNGMLLAFPTDVIEEVLLLESVGVVTHDGQEMLHLHEQWMPFVRLSQRLSFNCPRRNFSLETPPAINAPVVMVINRAGEQVAVHIDRCWGEQEVAIRRVEGSLPMPTGFTGCAIVGDGRIVPLVSVTELLDRTFEVQRERSLVPALLPANQTVAGIPAVLPQLPPTHKGTLLIVDDSINVRRFLALTLERAGYRVEQAKDGQDAIEKLQRGLTVRGVICDIEMPRLDGYGFLAKVKADAALKSLPVAMLSSRSSDKHRQLALSLGAAAYFTKPYNEQELLQALEKVLLQAV